MIAKVDPILLVKFGGIWWHQLRDIRFTHNPIITVKPVYSRHLGTQQNCPYYRGVLISECPQ